MEKQSYTPDADEISSSTDLVMNGKVSESSQRVSKAKPVKNTSSSDASHGQMEINTKVSSSNGGAPAKRARYEKIPVVYATEKDMGSALKPLQQFFLRRFEDIIKERGGNPSVIHGRNGWTIHVIRMGGSMGGLLDVAYESSTGRAFPTVVTALVNLGLAPSARSSKNMSKALHAILSRESYIKALLTQLLVASDGRCDEVEYDPDEGVQIKVRSQEENKEYWRKKRNSDVLSFKAANLKEEQALEDLENVHSKPRPEVTKIFKWTDRDSCLVHGPCTVLQWGQVVPHARGFHSSSNIIPFGFKSSKKEIDQVLNRVVECVCEVVAMNSDTEEIIEYSPEHTHDETVELIGEKTIPIFRITVEWKVGSGSTHVISKKQYQGRTAELAWTEVLNETVGLQEDDAFEEAIDGSVTEEEKSTILSSRKGFYDEIANIQAAHEGGLPRLSMDPAEMNTFFEAGIARLLEGMNGVVDCAKYEYISTRETDGGKKFATRAYMRAAEKTQLVERVESGDGKPKKKAIRSSKKRDAATPDTTEANKREQRNNALALPPLLTPLGTGYNSTLKYGEGLARDSAAMTPERRIKAKDVDRAIRVHKEIFHSRILKRRIQDSQEKIKELVRIEEKKFVDRVNQKSAMEKGKEKSHRRSQRPDPLNGLVKLDGHLFGKLLEVWDFLKTYPKVFNLEEIPSLEVLITSLKLCDPNFVDIQSDLVFASTPATEENDLKFGLTQRSATELLNKIGMLFAELLRPEFERIMGIDTVAPVIGGLSVKVNQLTWKEIARTVLVHSMSRECGQSENDTVAYLKGRPLPFIAEGNDKKMMKLLRKRINWQKSIASDYQESLTGFRSGIIARIPAPGMWKPHNGLQWQDRLLQLIHVAPTASWLVYEIIESAYHCCDGINHDIVQKVKLALSECLASEVFNVNDASQSKLNALHVLVTHDTGCSAGFEGRISKAKNIARAYLQVCQGNKLPGILAPADISISIETAYSSNESADVGEIEFQQRISTANARTTLVDLDDQGHIGNNGVGLDQTKKVAILGPDGQAVASTTYFTGTTHVSIFGGNDDDDDDDDDDGVIKTAQQKQQPWKFSAYYVDELDEQDQKDGVYEKLSLSNLRALEVLKNIMRNPQFLLFCWPVDTTTPQYYAHVPQPLCLFDIRRHLNSGGYENDLTAFYCDMMIIFENAMSYNSENSQIVVLAQKGITVFERMFFEMVLHWEHPLPAQDCCHICRTLEPVDPTKCVTCDRCDAVFHLHCVDPPLNRVPKHDWICAFCVEQRSVAVLHPNKVAFVQHPEDSTQVGQVISIEQINKRLRFVINFPHNSGRELWDGAKVRKYAQNYFERCKSTIMERDNLNEEDFSRAIPTCSKATSLVKSEEDMKMYNARDTSDPADPMKSFGELKECWADWNPVMPSGYDLDDFDVVCGLIRGYVGTQQSHYHIPSHLHDNHSFKSRNRTKCDPYWGLYRSAIASLTFPHDPDNYGALVWINIFRALMQRAISLPIVEKATSELEADMSKAVDAGMQQMRMQMSDISTLIRPCDVKIGTTVRQCDKTAHSEFVDEQKAKDLAKVEAAKEEEASAKLSTELFDEDECRAVLAEMEPEMEAMDVYKNEEDANNEDPKEPKSGENAGKFSNHHLIALIRRIPRSLLTEQMESSNSETVGGHGSGGTRAALTGHMDQTRLSDEEARQVLWELKRMSRYKARDDALHMHGLIAEIMNNVDLDCMGNDSSSSSPEAAEPGQPGQPGQPEQPGQPGQPGQPEQLEQKSALTQGQPDQPGQPEQNSALTQEQHERNHRKMLEQMGVYHQVLQNQLIEQHQADRNALNQQHIAQQQELQKVQLDEQLDQQKREEQLKQLEQQQQQSTNQQQMQQHQEILQQRMFQNQQRQHLASTPAHLAASMNAQLGYPDISIPMPIKSLFNLVSATTARTCTAKPSDALDIDEWCVWWDACMIELTTALLDILDSSGHKCNAPPHLYEPPVVAARPTQAVKREAEKQKSEHAETFCRVCDFCGQREQYLASHFVRGETWEEWERGLDDMLKRTTRSSTSTLSDCKLLVTSLNGTVAQSVSVLETFLDNARNRVIWRAADDKIYQQEVQDVANDKIATLHYQDFPPVCGSLIVHEVCMEYMAKCREAALPTTCLRDENYIMDVLVSLGRGKAKPIGVDHLGGRYWLFPGSRNLYICSPPNHISKIFQNGVLEEETIGDIPALQNLNSKDPDFNMQYMTTMGYSPVPASTWVAYRTDEELSALLRWLNPGREDERRVYKTLCYLYPNALELSKKPEKQVYEAPSLMVHEELGDSNSRTIEVEETDNGYSSMVSESEINSDSDLSAHGSSPSISEDEQDMDIAATDSEDEESYRLHNSFADRSRKSKVRANRQMYAQAQEERQRTRKRRLPVSNDMDTESEDEFKIAPIPVQNDQEYDQIEETGAVYYGDEFQEEDFKPVRVLHPDDEPKKRGRPQAPPKDLGGKLNQSAALHKAEALLMGTVVPTVDRLEYVSDRLVMGHGRSKKPNALKVFEVNTPVVVQNQSNGILWRATILLKGKEIDTETGYAKRYKVRYDKWGADYDSWVSCKQIAAITDTARIGRHIRKTSQMINRSRQQYAENEHWNFPEPIYQLRAAAVLEDMDLQAIDRSPITFSDATPDNSFGVIKAALLVVEAALPDMSMDENEEKWGPKNLEFASAWKEAVAQASTAADLMCALMMLEYSIKSSWLKPTGIKLLGLLPSRHILCRRATVGLVAVRLFALDAAIRYEKNIEVQDSGKNVPSIMIRQGRPVGPRTRPISKAAVKQELGDAQIESTEDSTEKMDEEKEELGGGASVIIKEESI